MRLLTGKRIGQSHSELVAAVSFSFFIHFLVVAAVLFLYIAAPVRMTVPITYRVNLIDLPAEAPSQAAAPAAPPAAVPVPPVPVPKPKEPAAKLPKPRAPVKAMAAPPTAPKRDAMPEMEKAKAEPAPKPAAAETESASAGRSSGKQATVTMAAPAEFSAGSAFEWYSHNVRRKITGNWKHPIVPNKTRAKVVFTILRSGIVEQVKLEEASGNFAFDQAAIRAIQSSSPFPALPEDFLRPSAVFSVDLLPEQ